VSLRRELCIFGLLTDVLKSNGILIFNSLRSSSEVIGGGFIGGSVGDWYGNKVRDHRLRVRF